VYSPYAVENGAVRKDAYVYVGHDDVVEMTLLLVGEEQIRHPDAISLRQSQVFQPTCGKGMENGEKPATGGSARPFTPLRLIR
jgi:hypothetical protein